MSGKENFDLNFNQIYKGFINLILLLEKQGYDISKEKDISLQELQTRIETNTINFMVEGNDKKCYVIYHLSKQLRPSHIQEYSEDIYQFREIIEPTDQLIIVSKDKFNTSTNTGLSITIENVITSLYSSLQFYINVFVISTLQFDILSHSLVPKHEILTNDEVAIFKKKYNIVKDSTIPTISRFDPVVKAIGMKPGQICKITRPSKICVESLYYRICI